MSTNKQSWALLAHSKIDSAGSAVLAASPDINEIVERAGMDGLCFFTPEVGTFVLVKGDLDIQDEDEGICEFTSETRDAIAPELLPLYLNRNNTWLEDE